MNFYQNGDYNKIFADNIDRDFYYNNPNYQGNKLVVGTISLEYAISRKEKKDEYYTLVNYTTEEILPDYYVPVSDEMLQDSQIEEGKLLATVAPNVRCDFICRDGGIQLIHKIPVGESEFANDSRYILGPGPADVLMSELAADQIVKLKNMNEKTR